MSAGFLMRLVGMAVFAVIGFRMGEGIAGPLRTWRENQTVGAMALAGAALGLLLTPYFTVIPFQWIRVQIRQLPANTLFTGVVGLAIGLVISVLLAVPLSMLPGEAGNWLPLGAAILSCYVCTSVMVMRQQDMVQAVGGFV
ncbi:MAG: hypothetical protein AAB289_09700, partial [Chloroflexota bacterium]